MPNLQSQASTFRAGNYQFTGYLGTLPRTIVLSRAVNMATITYPVTAITFDNAYSGTGATANVREGMTVVVYHQNTSTVKGLLRVATGGTSSTVLQVNEFSRGTLDLADNDRFEVVDEYRLWDMLVSQSEALNKDSRVIYVDQTDNYPPVANGGGAWFGLVDVGGSVATVELDGSDSFAVDPANTSGLTYLWDVGDGTITVGTSTDATITATFPVGFRHVKLTVTDADNSESMTKTIPVRVYSAASPPLAVQMDTLELDAERGASVTFRLPKGTEASITSLPDGAFVVYFEDERYGGTPVSYGSNHPADRSHIKFVGYLVRDSISITPEGDEVTFEAVGPLAILEQLGALPQMLVNKASPGKWHQLKTLTIRRALWYLLYWHATAMLYFDFYWPDGTEFAYTRLEVTDSSNLAAQLRDVAYSINVDVTCDRVGSLRLVRNPNYLSVADRASRTTTYAATTADLLTLDLERNHHHTVKQVVGEGITTTGDPVFSKSPGHAPGPGAGSETFSRQIVASQSQLNIRTGDHEARLNGLYYDETTKAIYPVPQGVRALVPDGYDVFDPAYREFVTLALAASSNGRAVTFSTATRWMVERVLVRYQAETGSKDIELTLNHETHKPAGVTYIPPQPSEIALPPLPDFDLVFPNFDFGFGFDFWGGLRPAVGSIAAFSSNGNIYYTTEAADFNTPSYAGGPVWTATTFASLGISGGLHDFVVDAFSPGYLGTVGGAINGWLVTNTGIYRITDIFGSVAATLQHTFASAAFPVQRTMDASFGFQNWAAVASDYDRFTPVSWTYTTDGTNWTEVALTGTVGGTHLALGANEPGLHISSKVAGLGYMMAHVTGVGRRLHRTTDYGATWSIVSPAIDPGAGNWSTIHAPFDDNAGDTLLWLSGRTGGDNTLNDQNLYFAQVGSSGATNISPGLSGPGNARHSFASLGANRQRMAFIENVTSSGGRQRNLWTTTTGGRTAADWVFAQSWLDNWQSLALVGGAASQVMYLWGINNAIAYSEDFGVTIDSRRGNLPDVSSEIMNICGRGA